MSIEMMTLVWRHSRNKGSVLLMELAIADHAHDDGTGAHPSIARLAKYARSSERNVQFVLQQLINSKEVAIQYNAGPKGTNCFVLNVKLLQRLPDQIPQRRRGEKFAPLKAASPLKPTSPLKRASGVKKTSGGVKSSVKGVKSSARGVKSSVNYRVKAASPDPDPSSDPSGSVIEPSSRASRSSHSAEQIDRHWQMMMMEFGIDPLVGKEIAELPHVTPEYLQTWITYNQNDMERKMRADREKDILGAGFFVKHLKAGDLPYPVVRAQRERERDAAHAGDKAYWQVKQARRSASPQPMRTRQP